MKDPTVTDFVAVRDTEAEVRDLAAAHNELLVHASMRHPMARTHTHVTDSEIGPELDRTTKLPTGKWGAILRSRWEPVPAEYLRPTAEVN